MFENTFASDRYFRKINIDKLISVLILVFAFLTYFYISSGIKINGNVNNAPDEIMRVWLSNFIIKNGYLPNGNETEIVSDFWGFSYAYSPYTPQILGAFFYKIAELFTQSPRILLAAIRFPSVLFGTGTVYVCMKIGNMLFKRKSTVYTLALFCALLPQFAFLSAYTNNDIFALFTVSLVVYCWIRGVRDNWSMKTCIIFAISLGLMALSYYNVFMYLPLSLIFFILSYKKLNEKFDKAFAKKIIYMFAIIFAIAAWFYVRAYIIHDGDIFGFKTLDALSELVGAKGFKPSERVSPSDTMSVFRMLFRYTETNNWIEMTLRGVIGYFGHYSIRLTDVEYNIYYSIFGLGVIAALVAFIPKVKKINFNTRMFIILNLIACISIIGFSIYYSYTDNYQPQGRYIIGTIIPFLIVVAYGYEALSTAITIKFKETRIDFSSLVQLFYIYMFYFVYTHYITIMYI